MNNITQSLNQLIYALKSDLPVMCRNDNTWYVENKWIAILQKTFGINSSRLLSIAYTLNNYYDEIEKIPVQFNDPPTNMDNQLNYIDLLEMTEKLLFDLKDITSSNGVNLVNQLKRKFIALKYRLEAVNGGNDRASAQKKLQFYLGQFAKDWKKEQKNFLEKSLSEQDLLILSETSRYPLFVELLLHDEKLRSSYFEWTLRDKNPIAPFIEFPCLQQKLVDCALSGRISRYSGDILKIQKITDNQKIKKILTLPIEGKPISLLDENLMITFRGNYKLTLKEVFQIFKNKMFYVGNLELLEEGIINWNAHQLGWWNADEQNYHQIDLEKSAWWTHLPLLEKISKAQAAKRYNVPADGIQWIVGAKATRGNPTLDYDQTHAFMELAIPSPQKDFYTIYNFGKFAFEFPSSFFSSLSTFCLNMHATIAYPDENIFYTYRQHACYPFLMTKEQGLKLMSLIKEDMLKSRELNLVFQIESENCAKWLYEKLSIIFENKVPDFFRMSLMKTEPMGFVGACFALMRKLGLSEMTQFKLLTLIHIPFGAGKGTCIIENGQQVIKALNTHEFWKTSVIYLPALLVEKIHSGQLMLKASTAIQSDFKTLYSNLPSKTYSNYDSRNRRNFKSPYSPILRRNRFPIQSHQYPLLESKQVV